MAYNLPLRELLVHVSISANSLQNIVFTPVLEFTGIVATYSSVKTLHYHLLSQTSYKNSFQFNPSIHPYTTKKYMTREKE